MVSCRVLAKRFSVVTVIDVGSYRDVFDAIDEAQQQAERYEPGPVVDPFIIRATDASTGKVIQLYGYRPPTMPVHVKDPARLAVALLQRNAWLNAALWVGVRLVDPAKPIHATLPFASTLMQRKLWPEDSTARDLIRLAIEPVAADRQKGAGDIFYSMLKILERCYPQVLPRRLLRPLQQLMNDVEEIRSRHQSQQRRFGSRVTTKHLDKAIDRLRALMERAPGGRQFR